MKPAVRGFLRNNGLMIALFALFFLTLGGQIAAGVREYNSDQRDHGQQEVSTVEYVQTGHFIEGVFENWESEFLQMAAFVLLTVVLRQKGSSESKELEGEEEVDADPRVTGDGDDAPWPVRRGGLVLAVYEHSLSIALFLLFVASFALHAAGGAADYNSEQLAHGGATVSTLGYIGTARFWFESFQNWQSEFLSVGVLILLSIYLRERGSPQSKPVAAAHADTGGEADERIKKSLRRTRRRKTAKR